MAYRRIDAELAEAVYKTHLAAEQMENFSEPNWVCKVVMENDFNHYKGCIFMNTETKEIAVVHKGTNIKNTGDIKANLNMLAGAMPDQKSDADYLMKKAKIYARNHNISFEKIRNIGHSLGGSLAQLVGHEHEDIKTITFNPYGVGSILGSEKEGKEYYNITNHISADDPVSIFPGSDQIGETYSYDSCEALVDKSKLRDALQLGNSFQQHSIKLFNNSKLNLWAQPGKKVEINTAFSRLVLGSIKSIRMIHNQITNKVDRMVYNAKSVAVKRLEKRKKQVSDAVNHFRYDFGERVVYTLETIENEFKMFDSELSSGNNRSPKI